MKGKLYLVATPIGNLGDITYRAVEVLKSVDFVACEDTRHTLTLMNYLGIKKPLYRYDKLTERKNGSSLCDKIERGENAAVVSDAGMPCISDPGAVIVREARARGIDVTVVPGACAAVSALALCGIDGGFTFIGFLPDRKKEAEAILEKQKDSLYPVVFYTAPHDVKKLTEQLNASFGARKVYAVKELTKMYETVYEGVLGDFSIDEPRGEFVFIVMPGEPKKEEELSDERIGELLRKEIADGKRTKEAVASVAERFGLPKNRVYKIAVATEY